MIDCVFCDTIMGKGERGEMVDEIDRIGRLVDAADNYLALEKLNMPIEMKLDAFKTGLRELSRDLKALYVELADENPWEE